MALAHELHSIKKQSNKVELGCRLRYASTHVVLAALNFVMSRDKNLKRKINFISSR